MKNIPEVRYLYNDKGNIMPRCFLLYMDGKRYFFSYDTCMFSMQFERDILYITKLSNYRSVTTAKQMNNAFKAMRVPYTAKEYYESKGKVIAINLCKQDE